MYNNSQTNLRRLIENTEEVNENLNIESTSGGVIGSNLGSNSNVGVIGGEKKKKIDLTGKDAGGGNILGGFSLTKPLSFQLKGNYQGQSAGQSRHESLFD